MQSGFFQFSYANCVLRQCFFFLYLVRSISRPLGLFIVGCFIACNSQRVSSFWCLYLCLTSSALKIVTKSDKLHRPSLCSFILTIFLTHSLEPVRFIPFFASRFHLFCFDFLPLSLSLPLSRLLVPFGFQLGLAAAMLLFNLILYERAYIRYISSVFCLCMFIRRFLHMLCISCRRHSTNKKITETSKQMFFPSL